ncbi:MAG: DUF805 domain-containing protein [Verrucomicrobiae bacterium]|nr:DUF805 domain-containing protein [Verrucomicrobiae bacterium]MCP5518271.1 DUF805 domain-containing protein [Verrucomicrobiales bacterium]MCP5526773.1 DUF805 domain-containing protein [Verrucomicrobiales bacterium]
MDWYLKALKNYVGFSGRARRTEYWMFVLFNLIAAIVLGIADAVLGTGGLLGAVYALAVFLPGLAVAIRRLHDTSRSGWWILIGFVPIVGIIVLLVFAVQDSTPGSNEYGPCPK